MAAINIPEPCHENWGEMTPTQRGAFCQKCAIDVVDFSKMQNDEVAAFLKSNGQNHLCGRFSNEQLVEINLEHWWTKTSLSNRLSKFVCALLIGFGVTLFNGLNAQTNQKIKYYTLGEVAIPTEIDTSKVNCGTSNENEHRKGKVAVQETEEIEEPLILGDTTITETFIQGDIFYLPEDTITEEIDTATLIELEKSKEAIKPRYTLETKNGVRQQQEPLKAYKLETTPLPIPNKKFEAKVYPNPTTENSTLSIKSNESERFEVLLFDANGKLIEKIFVGILTEESREFDLNMKNLTPGFYFIQIQTSKGTETLKIHKI